MNSNNIVKDLITYLNTQDNVSISCNIQISDKPVLNSACIELLSWLKLEKKRENWISEGRRTQLKPLELNDCYEWCALLKKLVANEPIFNELFEVNNNNLYFKESISNELRSQIREDAFTLYNPPRFE